MVWGGPCRWLAMVRLLAEQDVREERHGTFATEFIAYAAGEKLRAFMAQVCVCVYCECVLCVYGYCVCVLLF